MLIVFLAIIVLFSRYADANLITNSDFSLGNTEFSSGYTYDTSNVTWEGVYTVGANPQLYHRGATSFGDHTTGSGMMLIANGCLIQTPLSGSKQYLSLQIPTM